jgi:hypothetical protein
VHPALQSSYRAAGRIGHFLIAPLFNRDPDLPARVGPVEFGTLGKLIAVRCPHDFDHVMRRAGGQWEPGSRRWLLERRRIGPVIRALRRQTDPLFRQAGMTLD